MIERKERFLHNGKSISSAPAPLKPLRPILPNVPDFVRANGFTLKRSLNGCGLPNARHIEIHNYVEGRSGPRA